jgi:hypothetical protein
MAPFGEAVDAQHVTPVLVQPIKHGQKAGRGQTAHQDGLTAI